MRMLNSLSSEARTYASHWQPGSSKGMKRLNGCLWVQKPLEPACTPRQLLNDRSTTGRKRAPQLNQCSDVVKTRCHCQWGSCIIAPVQLVCLRHWMEILGPSLLQCLIYAQPDNEGARAAIELKLIQFPFISYPSFRIFNAIAHPRPSISVPTSVGRKPKHHTTSGIILLPNANHLRPNGALTAAELAALLQDSSVPAVLMFC